MRDLGPCDPLPSPVRHRINPDLRPVAKARGQQALPCSDCGTWTICDKSATWARCWECSQPKAKEAP